MNKSLILGIVIGVLVTLVLGLGYDLYALNKKVIADESAIGQIITYLKGTPAAPTAK